MGSRADGQQDGPTGTQDGPMGSRTARWAAEAHAQACPRAVARGNESIFTVRTDLPATARG
eukprot:4721982-Prymnesium_polylepis.1